MREISSCTTAELVSFCARENTPEAWEEFVRRFQPVVAGTVWRTLRRYGHVDAAVAEDLVQETFLRLCEREKRALREFSSAGENAFFGFMKAVATTTALDHMRRLHAEKRRWERNVVPLDSVRSVVSPPSQDAAIRLELDEVDRDLRRSTGKTAERDRKIFWLHHEQGMTPAEIASDKQLRIKEKGVETLLARLKRKVRLQRERRGGAA